MKPSLLLLLALPLLQVFPAAAQEESATIDSEVERQNRARERERVAALNLPSEAPESTRRFTPYFDIGLNQGLFVPSKGIFFSGSNLNSNVGLLTNLRPNHALFGLYAFDYQGPGFHPQDGKEFLSRSLAHNFSFEYRYKFQPHLGPLKPSLRLRPGLSYGTNLARTVANEVWGEGLYDFDSIGGQLALDSLHEWGSITGQFLYRQLSFPNYTDLLREFQNAGTQAELSGSLQDQNVYELGLRGNWHKLFGGVRYNMQNFVNEKIVDPSGTTGQYGGTAQKDTSLILNVGLQGSLWIFEAAPQVTYNMRRSNQNFLRFKSFGDASPVFVAKNYDYNEITLGVPGYLNFTSKYAVSGGISLTSRDYTDRPPRDTNNDYVAGQTQNNLLFTWNVGLRKRMNEISYLTLMYGFTTASSNNRFERYLPYNYTGHSVSFGYSLAY